MLLHTCNVRNLAPFTRTRRKSEHALRCTRMMWSSRLNMGQRTVVDNFAALRWTTAEMQRCAGRTGKYEGYISEGRADHFQDQTVIHHSIPTIDICRCRVIYKRKPPADKSYKQVLGNSITSYTFRINSATSGSRL
jgi:hypothetical protein